MPRILIIGLLSLFLYSCNNALVFSEFQANAGGSWSREDVKDYSFTQNDTLSRYNLFINIRNDNTYPYSNLFLITDLSFPDGTVVRDTLEYEMALPDGQWLGKGYGSLKENKLLYKENIVFPNSGVYTFEVAHAMRQNGSVEGVNNLIGITDVGIQIESVE
ncbi:MAG: gliding motility lipoprotein GldH [Eudoraea sp.]|nr:gliding motility lipoprotein GldH [Eudoraea sp.]MBT8211107.1 gliding motility lipoprotein GldH [Eudoraea sp.]NNK31095.1 gliding motility lipoprotein GldH [Flavobacteriaceae bacterium]